MKKTQDKMALIFLIVNGLGSLNIQIESACFIESAGVIGVLFRRIVKKLSSKTIVPFVHFHSYPLADRFMPIAFKLDIKKKIRIYHRIQWNVLHVGDYFKCVQY